MQSRWRGVLFALERQFQQLLTGTAGHSLSRKADVLSHLLGLVGKEGQTSYLLYLFMDNNLGTKKHKEVSEINFGYSFPEEETN